LNLEHVFGNFQGVIVEFRSCVGKLGLFSD